MNKKTKQNKKPPPTHPKKNQNRKTNHTNKKENLKNPNANVHTLLMTLQDANNMINIFFMGSTTKPGEIDVLCQASN